MKFHTLTFAAATAALVLTGCETPEGNPDYTATGALTGAAIGVGSGALIGGARNGAAGALIGGAVGLIAGGLIGQSLDRDQQEQLRAQAPQTYTRVDQGQPLSTADVKALVKAGVSDDVVIAQIQNSHTAFHLSTADIIDLHNAGVSDRVVDFMINSANSADSSPSTTVVQTPPPPAPAETVVVAPAPGYIWVDGEWQWNGAWIWAGGHWVYPPYPRAVWIRGSWYRGPHGYYRISGHWR